MAYIGWLVKNREELLGLIDPIFPDVIAHHVTLAMLKKNQNTIIAQTSLDVDNVTGTIIDVITSDNIQVAVVEINGSTDRPSINDSPAGVYHITWSIDRSAGAKPVMSNAVIKEHGFTKRLNIPVELVFFVGH